MGCDRSLQSGRYSFGRPGRCPALETICPERGRDGVFPAGRLQICHPVLQKRKLFPHLLHLIQIDGGDLHSFFCLHLV